MTEAKKPRPWTAKRIATAKLSGKTTAEGFLSAHMGFLRGQTFLDPLLDAYDQRQILPTPTLQAVQSALMTHVLESEVKTQQAKLDRVSAPKGEKKKKFNPEVAKPANAAYTVTLMCKKYLEDGTLSIVLGEVEKFSYKIRLGDGSTTIVHGKDEADGHTIIETLTEKLPAEWGAKDYGEAMRLADRRLFQREDAEYAIIKNNFDRPVETVVQRGDAIARVLRSKKGPTSHTRGASTKTLGFTPHAKQTRVTGPWSHR